MTIQRTGDEMKVYRWVSSWAFSCICAGALTFCADLPAVSAQTDSDFVDGVELVGTINNVKAKDREIGDHKIVVKMVTTNHGAEIARGPFSISMFFSEDPVLNVDSDELLDTAIIADDLGPGATTERIKLRKAGLEPRTGFVIVMIDDGGVVAEGDEENNIMVRRVAGSRGKSIVQFASTGIPETPFIAVQESGAALFLEHNTLQNRIDAATFVTEDRDVLTLAVGKEGFPTRANIGTDIMQFANFSPTTVDIAVISEEGESQLFLDTLLDSDAQAFVSELAGGTAPKQLSSREGAVTRAQTTADSESRNQITSFRRSLSFVGSLSPLQELKSELGNRLMEKLGKFLEKKLAEREESQTLVEILDTTWDCGAEDRSKVEACVKGVVGSFEDLRAGINAPNRSAQLQELLRTKAILQERAASFPDEFNPSDPNDPFNQHNRSEPPIASFTIAPPSRIITSGETVSFDGLRSVAIEPGDVISEWKWELRSPSDEDVTFALNDCCEAQVTTGALSDVGSYFIFLTVTDSNGLRSIRRKEIRVQTATSVPEDIPEPVGDGPCDRDLSGHYEHSLRTAARSLFDFAGNACSGTGSQEGLIRYSEFEYIATPTAITLTYTRWIECVTISGKPDFGNWVEAAFPESETFNFDILDSGLRIFNRLHDNVDGFNDRPEVGMSCQ